MFEHVIYVDSFLVSSHELLRLLLGYKGGHGRPGLLVQPGCDGVGSAAARVVLRLAGLKELERGIALHAVLGRQLL